MERGYIKITEEEIGKPIVEVKIVNGTVWMFKHEIARLFDVHLQTVGNNFRSIFKSGVLREDDVTMERKMKNEKVRTSTSPFTISKPSSSLATA